MFTKKLKMRCPVCYAREMDVVMIQAAHDHMYCQKCGYSGSEGRTRELYADLRKKYLLIDRRLTLEELRRI
jgi:C4-type Zn-finger protein